MLVTFSTKAYADITMFGDVALKMLSMMGQSASVPGAIREKDVPLALTRLKSAIDAEKLLPPHADRNSDEPAVSLSNRALPLINLLAAAAKEKKFVTWK